ncbi:MAG: SPOR domain-containing protein [Burkholderiaceae bacterium]|nr:SPOR domain-containing protein [Burkholderiaceae bacterium]
MLRLLVLILLLANGLFYAWSQGLLQAWGWAPVQQSEPERLNQQIRPEAMRLLGTAELNRLEAQPVAGVRPTECLQAGLFDDKQAGALRDALTAALPAGSWQLEGGVEPARWIIYMGRYADNDMLNKKRGELRGLRVRFESLVNPQLEPGLSLGSFSSESAAQGALEELAVRGVRTARVLKERDELRGQWLRLPQADDSLRQRLDSFKPLLAGKPLRACN